ncbi:efflux RND transporter periplasmic adaptor subunit [Aureimonas jatrophae]|uniref:RND family efflux transporter, MFP subunit n=1 Tax=Aureimonas jatrophae TaxID=1166073 RepID=A0A1H0K4S3_9HYPH|nr:efflux RND transporter periplasmic adaptor subunit [Aureimonas jatrophae]MBB3950954.1 multidrug efflux pump subunit AcrA (membrane-fusion protein) [Aureimonas jatrophae]SDO51098.1 RND family efflux transporter, MFP subunit [Aureimonas jatrophae]
MTRHLFQRRRDWAALSLVLALGAAAPAHAQSGGSGGGSGGGQQAEGEQGREQAGERKSGIDLPLIGHVPLPGFLAGLFGGGEEGETSAEGGSGEGGQGGQNGETNGEPAAVIVQTVATQSVGDSFSFIGTIQPIEQVSIRARVDGYIQEVFFTGGQKVKQGDLLFQIEPAQYEASVRAAEAQLSGAQATVNQAQRDYNRQEELASSGVTARATLDTATANLENAQAALLQAQAALTQAQLNLSYTRITAAIDGEMSQPLITRGNYVSTTTTTDLATLTQLDPIWGVFPIAEDQLVTWQRVGVGAGEEAPIETAQNGRTGGAGGSGGDGEGEGDASVPDQAPAETTPPTEAGTRIASADGTGAAGAPPPPEGAAVDASASADDRQIGADYNLNLRLPNGADYQPAGDFDFVGNTVNSATGTVEARISFPNPGGFLLANQNVTLVASQKNPPMRPVVPQAAIQLSREGRSVLVVGEGDKIERRAIEVSAEAVGNNMAAVTSGLQSGERVVVRGSANVKEGTVVRPLTQEQADAEAQQRRAQRPEGGNNAEGGDGAQEGSTQGEGAQAPEGGGSQNNGQGSGSGGAR